MMCFSFIRYLYSSVYAKQNKQKQKIHPDGIFCPCSHRKYDGRPVLTDYGGVVFGFM